MLLLLLLLLQSAGRCTDALKAADPQLQLQLVYGLS
jgi:hypothetical protein